MKILTLTHQILDYIATKFQIQKCRKFGKNLIVKLMNLFISIPISTIIIEYNKQVHIDFIMVTFDFRTFPMTIFTILYERPSVAIDYIKLVAVTFGLSNCYNDLFHFYYIHIILFYFFLLNYNLLRSTKYFFIR